MHPISTTPEQNPKTQSYRHKAPNFTTNINIINSNHTKSTTTNTILHRLREKSKTKLKFQSSNQHQKTLINIEPRSVNTTPHKSQ